MIPRIIEFSARNRFIVLVLIVAIVGAGWWAVSTTPLDAIPDLSDVQVIVYTEWPDQSPTLVEDQVTYPLVTQLLSAPKVKAVRATSFFGFSLVYVIFEDGTDPYWARSRVLEYLSGMSGKLPPGVSPAWGRTRPGSAGGSNTSSSIRPASTASPTSGASRTGTSSTSSGPSPASPRWPRSAGSSGSTR